MFMLYDAVLVEYSAVHVQNVAAAAVVDDGGIALLRGKFTETDIHCGP